MLAGLKKDQEKMSKSDPGSAIFMEDSAVNINHCNVFQEDVKKKISNAYCPEKEVKGNPVMEYVKYIIFGAIGYFELERKQEFGGNK